MSNSGSFAFTSADDTAVMRLVVVLLGLDIVSVNEYNVVDLESGKRLMAYIK